MGYSTSLETDLLFLIRNKKKRRENSRIILDNCVKKRFHIYIGRMFPWAVSSRSPPLTEVALHGYLYIRKILRKLINWGQYCITWNTPPPGADSHLWASCLGIDTETDFPDLDSMQPLSSATCKLSVIIIRNIIVCELLKELSNKEESVVGEIRCLNYIDPFRYPWHLGKRRMFRRLLFREV